MALLTSQQGIDLIKSFEGCKLQAYLCPAGVWTIGYGHTAGVKQGQKITQEQAIDFLKADLAKFEKNVNKFSKYNWTQGEFDALVSFAYNVGSIDKLVANGTRDKKTIAEKMLVYNKANGKVLDGLTKRRQAERNLFLYGTSSVSYARSTVRYGSRGKDVTELQQILTNKGYSLGRADGDFGKLTKEAVIKFQSEHMLAPDGIVGPLTWTELLK